MEREGGRDGEREGGRDHTQEGGMEREGRRDGEREGGHIARLRIKKKLLGGLHVSSFPGHSQILSHRANTTCIKCCKPLLKSPNFVYLQLMGSQLQCIYATSFN